jgi:hypothetical protein
MFTVFQLVTRFYFATGRDTFEPSSCGCCALKIQYLRACAPLQIISTLLRASESRRGQYGGACMPLHNATSKILHFPFRESETSSSLSLSLRSFPLTCGIVFGVSDAEEREVHYILSLCVPCRRERGKNSDAGRMCECASSCMFVCLPLSSNTSQADETRARIRKSTRRSMIAHKKNWLRGETGVCC